MRWLIPRLDNSSPAAPQLEGNSHCYRIDLTTKPLTADFIALKASTLDPLVEAEGARKIIISKRPERTRKESKIFVKLSRFTVVGQSTHYGFFSGSDSPRIARL